MYKTLLSAFVIGITALSPWTLQAESKATALPLPKTVRVESSVPRGKVWAKLTAKQKKLAAALIEAANAGHGLVFYQSHRHSLALKKILTSAFTRENMPETKKLLGNDAFNEFLIYSAKFLDQGGPYANSNRKYVLRTTTPTQIEQLIKTHSPQTKADLRKEMVQLLTDPDYEVNEYPESQDGKDLEKTGGNLYEKGITGDEVKAVLDKSLKTTLNCRVVRTAKGLACDIQTVRTPGEPGLRIRYVVNNLRKARAYATTEQQTKMIDYMIKYFHTGDIEDFRQANIAWVRDATNSTVDFMLGWVEVYEDYLGRIASWESYVNVVDPDISKLAQGLAKKAQYFEDAMPYGEFKKKFPPGYAPPAIIANYFQELASSRSGGFNLPNFDDIRKNVGAKNVIRLPMPGETDDAQFKAMWRELLGEFLPTAKIETILKDREKIYQVLVLQHEIIGHGSGTYDTTKYAEGEDPVSALGSLGSALEEQRADLTALVFVADPMLTEIGVYSNVDEGKRIQQELYDYYLLDFLRRTAAQRSFTEAHQRGHWLFINHLLKEGAIGWAAKDGTSAATLENQVLVVKDYDKFAKVSKDLLAELQRIKAVRDEKALKDIFEKYAPLAGIQEAWAQAVIKRGQDLLISAGYVEQPWRLRGLNYETQGGTTLETIAPHWKAYYH